MDTSSATRRHETSWYEIRVQGRLDPMRSAWLDGMTFKPGTVGTTTLIRGPSRTRPHSTDC